MGDVYLFFPKHYSKGCCSPSWCLSLQQRFHVLKALFFLQKTGHIVSVYIPYDIQVFHKLLGGWSSTLQQYGCCHFVVGQMHKRTWRLLSLQWWCLYLGSCLYLVEEGLWLLQPIVHLCFSEKSYAQDQSYWREAFCCTFLEPCRCTARNLWHPPQKEEHWPSSGYFLHTKVNAFSLSFLLFYTWRSFDNICRVWISWLLSS